MNIGSKPDLPDGTLVKAVFDEGGVIAEVDKLRWSIADHIGQTYRDWETDRKSVV